MVASYIGPDDEIEEVSRMVCTSVLMQLITSEAITSLL
jgi:hypothetical protein